MYAAFLVFLVEGRTVQDDIARWKQQRKAIEKVLNSMPAGKLKCDLELWLAAIDRHLEGLEKRRK